MYFNVHSAAFPGGEIRGQIIQAKHVFSAMIDGARVGPPTPSTSTGCGRLELDPATSTLSYVVDLTPLSSTLNSANLHTGVAGQSGSSFHALSGGPISFVGSTVVNATQIADLLEGGVYVDVHSSAFPGGELRGQVRPDPYVFGFGGNATNGRTRVDAFGYDGTASTSVTVSLTNALPNAGVLVFISGGTTFWTLTGGPLPAFVAPYGTVWIDLSPSFAIPLTADGTGCAEFTAPVPTGPAFDCFKAYGQCVSVDPIAGATPLVLSDAFELTILP
jgi:hypothetical protein